MEFMVAYVALTVGACLGFFLASVLAAGKESVGAAHPTRPEALAATPEEIVAVYEARLEMERRGESCIHPSRQGDHKDRPYGGGESEDDEIVMVDYFPMSKKALRRGSGQALEKWEKEQSKKERRRAK